MINQNEIACMIELSWFWQQLQKEQSDMTMLKKCPCFIGVFFFDGCSRFSCWSLRLSLVRKANTCIAIRYYGCQRVS